MTAAPEFNWSRHTWDVIDQLFKDPDALIAHQIRSFDDLLVVTIPSMMQHHCPIVVSNGSRKASFKILKIYLSKPVEHGKDTGYQPLYPHTAKLRDLTYGAPVFIDYEQTFSNGTDTFREVEEKVPLWTMPIMVGSSFCHLYGKTVAERIALNECRYDRGGYFIVKGAEKVVIAQERPVDNKIMLFKEGTNSNNSFEARAEVKSTKDQRFYPIKTCSIYLTKSGKTKRKKADDSDQVKQITGKKFECGIPHIKTPKGRNGIPLFIVFKALGIVKDRTIFEMILGDTSSASNEHINMLIPSAQEAGGIKTQLDAIKYISTYINYMPPKEEEDTEEGRLAGLNAKLQYTKDVLNREYLSHIGQNGTKKAAFLATMTRKLMEAIVDPVLFSDRDHYSNKRVDLVGPLLSQIIRFNFQKLIRALKTSFVQHIERNADGVNPDVRAVLQKCDIETRVRYALSTGNWHTSRAHANSESKKGTAQVLQRLSYLGALSHLRRIQSPLERSGSKHEPPRRLHPTQVGKICPAETPEGEKVGVVKNMALTCHISIEASSYPVRFLLDKLGITDTCTAEPSHFAKATNIFVNGDLVGIIEDPVKADKIYQALRLFKLNGKLGNYTSIAWFKEQRDLVIHTDGGRYCRPLYVLNKDNHFKLDAWVEAAKTTGYEGIEGFTRFINERGWNELINGSTVIDAGTVSEKSGAVIEYLDTNEDETNLIAIFPHQLVPGRIHRFIEVDDRLKCRALLGYKDSRFSLMNSGDNLSEIHSYIKNAIPTKYRTMFDQITVDNLVSLESSIVDLSMPKDVSLEVKLFAEHLNRFIYSEFLIYTHCELHPAMWHSVIGSATPFPDHNQSPRNAYQASMGKQAIGHYATNHRVRVDTMANTQPYAQRPLVQPRTCRYTKFDELPHGFQCVVAIACFSGYNQEDSVLVNQAAIERGMFNTIYTRTITNQLQKHKTANTTQENFGIPPESKTIDLKVGTGDRDRYQAVDRTTGRPKVGTYVDDGDVLIAKYKKIPGAEAGEVLFSDASSLVKEPGVVDMVIPNERFTNDENADGYHFVKARTAVLRKPEIADKLASRSAQKGTIGMLYRPEDMPCTRDGIVPDIIMNPHAIPSRMTIAQVIECVLGKTALMSGRRRDATPFTSFSLADVKKELAQYGFEYNSNENMYNGQTGEMFKTAIFIGPVYYQRLKHMVADKIHARDLGPVQLLTRQPAEGRSREGGLRAGEMERDCIIAHGMAQVLKEKQNESSDIFQMMVSKDRGDIVASNPSTGVYRRGETDIYRDESVSKVVMPFAMNLLLHEGRTIMIDIGMELD